MHVGRRRPWMLVAALLTVTACSVDSEPDPARDGSDTSQSPRAVIDAPGGTTTTRGLVTTRPSRFEFVDYQTSGGVGGVARSLKVWPDGRATCTKGNERADFRVPQATVAELRGALEAADMPALPPVNGTPTPEAAVSRVIFGGESVRFVGGSMPPALGPAVTILDRLLASGCP
jgi:hypothetical protein